MNNMFKCLLFIVASVSAVSLDYCSNDFCQNRGSLEVGQDGKYVLTENPDFKFNYTDSLIVKVGTKQGPEATVAQIPTGKTSFSEEIEVFIDKSDIISVTLRLVSGSVQHAQISTIDEFSLSGPVFPKKINKKQKEGEEEEPSFIRKYVSVLYFYVLKVLVVGYPHWIRHSFFNINRRTKTCRQKRIVTIYIC